MKNKTVAAIFAFFLGALGVHRFYLGQTGMGILYLLLSITGISAILGVVDAFVFLSMDNMVFDAKYNGREGYGGGRRGYDRQEERRDRRDNRYGQRKKEKRYVDHRKSAPGRTAQRPPKSNPHKEKGVEKYKDYDFDGAIVDFNKALAVYPQDVAVHFNIACAYSITENGEKAFQHLSQAVEYGFSDFEKIQEHDALAYIRIQDEFESFAKNGYRLSTTATIETASPAPEISENLLEQIKRLGELREKGFLTQEEFVEQKRKLLR